MRLVVDASIAVKWVFPDPLIEPGADRAVALERDAILVTADLKYARKASALGHILRLDEWEPDESDR